MDRAHPISDIRIDCEGAWYYKGAEMSRSDIIALFYKHLVQDEALRYFIQIGRQRYPVFVEDTAYVVWSVRWHDTEECFHLYLSDYGIEPLDPASLRIGKDNVPYCKVKNGLYNARFSRAGYYQLADHIEFDPLRDAYFISTIDRRYYIAMDQNPAVRERKDVCESIILHPASA